MALKGSRNILENEVGYFMDTVEEKGGVVCISTVGSGAALDDGNAVVEYSADPSGKVPVGILLQDTVNLDLTKTHRNYQDPNEVQVGSKVNTAPKCVVVTNKLYPGITVTGNEYAYVSHSGLITNVQTDETPKVGAFRSKVDEDGYAKVSINLPV